MINSENEYYNFDSELNKLKFFSEEFSYLLKKFGITLTNTELDTSGDIICYIEEELDYEHWNCKRFEEIIKDNIPYVQDIYYDDGYFGITFNVGIVELF